MKKNIRLMFLTILAVCGSAGATISIGNYLSGYTTGFFDNDTSYIGAELFVEDSDVEVIVKLVSRGLLGSIYLMHPFFKDSAQFIFQTNAHTGTPTEVNIGCFPRGTSLLFKYVITDTSASSSFIGSKSYTGQNRPLIDPYISDKSVQGGYCWAAACRLDSIWVRVGFDAMFPSGNEAACFMVTNSSIGFIEKSKIPSFICKPQDTAFTNDLSISFEINPEALISRLVKRITVIVPIDSGSYRSTKVDSIISTIAALDKPGTSLHYYYTLDGTDPRTSATRADYVAPFTISTTTTVKAYAAIEGDTNWYPSDVVTRTYIKDPTTVARAPSFTSPQAFTSAVRRGAFATAMFDISGRRLSAMDIRRSGGVVLLRQDAAVTRQVLMPR